MLLLFAVFKFYNNECVCKSLPVGGGWFSGELVFEKHGSMVRQELLDIRLPFLHTPPFHLST